MNHYSLSNAQLNILDTELFYNGMPINIVGGVCLFSNTTGIGEISDALLRVVAENDFMRTQFAAKENEYYRYVVPFSNYEIDYSDFRGKSEDTAWEELESEYKTPFSFWDNQLYKFRTVTFPDGRNGFWIKAHHIICDADKLYSFCELVSNVISTTGSAALPSRVNRYMVSEKAVKRALKYWSNNEIGLIPSLSMPRSIEADRFEYDLPKDCASRLYAHATNHQIPVSTILESAYYIALSVLFDEKTLPIGLMYLDSNSESTDGLLSPSASVVPILINMIGSETLSQLQEKITEQHYFAYRHSCIPYRDILSAVKSLSENKRGPLYQYVYSYHQLKSDKTSGYSIKWMFNGCSEVPLKLSIIPEEDSFTFCVDTQKDTYFPSFAQILCDCICLVIEQICTYEETDVDGTIAAVESKLSCEKSFRKERLCIASSFTIDPVCEYLKYWARTENSILNVKLAPYNQVPQMLLDSKSAFYTNNQRINFIVLRLEDAIRYADNSASVYKDALNEVKEEVINALKQYPLDAPKCLVMCFPFSGTIDGVEFEYISTLNSEIARTCDALGNVHYVDSNDLHARYIVKDVIDSVADAEGHIPYTAEYFAAVGTHIWRTICAIRRFRAYKVLVVDCDNTLWRGVCGEVGPTNVEITGGYEWFQQFLLSKRTEGYLLAISSKNNPEDVHQVFTENSGMILKESDISAWRVSWSPKANEIRSIAQELSLGLDSFVFFDDNPVECDAMMEDVPEVLTIQIPVNDQQIPPLVGNVWSLDSVFTTAEDRTRADMYQAEKKREEARTEEKSLRDYLKRLDIQLYFYQTAAEDLDRIAQLTQRTNQFNMNGIKYSKDDIVSFVNSPNHECYSVYVKDSYGDYGIIGTVIVKIENNDFLLSTFVLSCRILGREIEVAILREVSRIAQLKGFVTFRALVKQTPKNSPFMSFWHEYVTDDNKVVFPEDKAPKHIAIHREKNARIVQDGISEKPRPQADIHVTTEYQVSKPDIIRTSIEELNSFIPSCFSDYITSVLGKSLHISASATIIEQVRELWKSVLGANHINDSSNYFDIGGDSLRAVQLVSVIEKEFHTLIPVSDIYKYPTVRDLAGYLSTLKPTQENEFSHAEFSEPMQLSSAQKRMFILHFMNSESLQYNETQVLELLGEYDVIRLEEALTKTIQRHTIFRTAFYLDNGIPMQRLLSEVDVGLQIIRCEERSWMNEVMDFRKPFSLDCPPLIRFALLKTSDSHRSFLVFDAHHMVIDGTSYALFSKEFVRQYDGEELETDTYQYHDYVEWENTRRHQASYQDDLRFWLDQFTVMPEPLSWVGDDKREKSNGKGKTLFFSTGEALKQALESFANQFKVTPFTVLLTCYALSVYHYSDANDLVVGVPSSNRLHHNALAVMGNFVNSLPIRISFSGDEPIGNIISRVFALMTEALSHQGCPYEAIVEALHCDRQFNRNPLFDTMFSLQGFAEPAIETRDMRMVRVPFDFGTAKNDIRLFGTICDQGLLFELEYDTALFDDSFMKEFQDTFLNFVRAIIEDQSLTPDAVSSSLKQRQKQQDRAFLAEYNATARPGFANQFVHNMIQAQAEKAPSSTALICDDHSISYSELNTQASKLARRLRSIGISERDKVGIVLHRSPELIIGLLAIMKAGAVYVPADPAYPQERIDYMFSNSGITHVLTGQDVDLPAGYTCHDIIELMRENTEEALSELSITPDDLMYVLYTSGSTGKPKGVMIKHGAVSNFILSLRELIPYEEGSAILATTTICFDIAAIELWRTLVFGGTIVLATDNERMDLDAQQQLIKKYSVKELNMTPSQMSILMLNEDQNIWHSIKTVMIGGEALPPSLLEKMQRVIHRARIYNMYGPTETTIYSSIMDLTAEKEVSIGRPVANTVFYVIDEEKRILPVGKTGELCIGGAGLAVGYMNRPDLDERQFVLLPELGIRVYKTGDLTTLRSDGKMICHGRIDNQVKVRGYRVELEEIEQSILKSGLCLECTAFSIDSEHIGAIFTASESQNAKEIMDYISGLLPKYMLPSRLVKVGIIPLNANGKADRKKARELAMQETNEPIEIKTSGYIQDILIAMFRKITLNNSIGIEDSFFEAGGSSLGVFRILSEIESVFGIKLQYSDIYKQMTVSAVSSRIEIAIRNGDRQNVESFCHRLNDVSEERLIFAFPPIMGYGLSFMHIAKELQKHVLYAFDFLDEEELIEKYTTQIRQLQATGPYRLLAYSAGAEIAVDVANALCKEDEVQVVFVDGFYNEISRDRMEEATDELTRIAIDFIEQTPGDKLLYHTIAEKMQSYMEYIINKRKTELDPRVRVSLVFSDSINAKDAQKLKKRFGPETNCYRVSGTHFELVKKSHAMECACRVEESISNMNSKLE